jgi:hypothetical protein
MMEASEATAKIDGADDKMSTVSGEMDDKLDGTLPDLLLYEDVTAKTGIRFENVTLTVRTRLKGKG